ncbi:MAG: hypothetical protein AMXMBFR4_28880 [Candidatus Hydrogenedentota bacterium]
MKRRLAASVLMALCAVACFAQTTVIQQGIVSVEFPDGHAELARQSLATLSEALESYSDRLPAGDRPIRVAICPSIVEFRKFAGPFTSHGITGVSLPEKGIIAVKTPDLTPPEADYRGTLRHELVHVLLARNTAPGNLPRWLNEGIAMTMSGEKRWGSKTHVAQMFIDGRLLEYRDLELSFLEPGQETEFGDAYAQALSMTRYLKKRLGDEEFWALVRSLQDRSFGSALSETLGVTPYGFWEEWTGSMRWPVFVFSIITGLTLFQVMAALVIWAWWRKHRRGRKVLAEWEKEEEDADAFAEYGEDSNAANEMDEWDEDAATDETRR